MSDQVVQVVNINVVSNAGKAGKEAEQAAGGFKGFAQSIEKLTGVSIGALGALGAMSAGFKFLRDSVQVTIKEADEVERLGRVTGMAAEDASALYQMSDDLFISTETLTLGMQRLRENGMDPTLDGLELLIKQYGAIEDPAKKASFAVEMFGQRGGKEMQKLLAMGPQAFAQAREAIKQSGLIFDQADLDTVKQFRINMDNAMDSIKAKSYQAGLVVMELINALAKAGGTEEEIAANNTRWAQERNRMWQQGTVVTDQQTEAARRYLETHYQMTEQQMQAAQAWGISLDIQTETVRVFREHRELLWDAGEGYATLAKNTGITDIAWIKADPTLKMVTDSFGELTKQLMFNVAAQDLDADAALRLARDMGLVNEDTLTAIEMQEGLRQQFQDGTIDVETYARRTKELQLAIDTLQSKHIQITTEYIELYRKGQRGDRRHGGDQQDYIDDNWASGVSNFTVPSGYPNDDFVVGLTSGERVSVQTSDDGTPGNARLEQLIEDLPRKLARATRDAVLLAGR